MRISPWFVAIIMLSIYACGGAEDRNAPAADETRQVTSTGPITLTGGRTSLTVDPEYGARITSLKYDGREILQTERDSAGYRFGSTVWTSPQSEWNWPPPATYDTGPYRVVRLRDNVYVFTSGVDDATGFSIEKRVQMTDSGEIGLRYRVTNESGSPAGVAAWEVTRLPYRGRVEFYVSDTVWSTVAPLPVTFADDVGTITFDATHREAQKVFATLLDTAVRYYVDDLVFTKQTVITGGNQVAEGQAPLEVFLDPVNQFAEFELQGGYYRLEPGQQAELRTKWSVRKE